MTAAISELGRELQLVHAAQWLYSVNGEPFVPGDGDPYACLVRGFDDHTARLHAACAERGPLWRSRLGTWVAGSAALPALLGHPALVVAAAVPQAEPWLPAPDRQRAAARGLAHRGGRGTVRAAATVLRRLIAEAVAGLRPGPADLITAVAAPLAATGYAALLGVAEDRHAEFAAAVADTAPAVDALLCPQSLAATVRAAAGVRGLRELLASSGHGEAGLVLAVAGTRAATDLLGEALLRLADRPGEWARAGSDPAAAAAAVRAATPTHGPWHLHPLTALTPLEAAGVRIGAGDRVTLVPEPGGTAPAPYARLLLPGARAVAEEALRHLAVRFPHVRSDGAPVRARRAPVTRRLIRVPALLGEEETR
ncbi:hypothetical protein SZN_07163 [Streptomyces zinciresistens K42]|uniref:P450-derived glycosyltransferase activator n=1 Tax=Streptomyces zinciresistens K42 TaxID=700597 RepID=G2G7H0_9ACTN|nr:hypothetical protein [Streptomyces zinciresistens]EGX60540.1 hypothetical protein SZN_07163 [Streptomyces zinciresistens K42]